MAKGWRILIIALGTLVVLFFAGGFIAGNILYELALNPHSDKTQVLEADSNQIEFDDEYIEQYQEGQDWLSTVGYFTRSVESDDGLLLNGYFIENQQPGKSWVIICHGYGNGGWQMAAIGQDFYQRGFSVLMPDARGCGRSEGHYYGMGWHDRLDLLCWIDDLNAEYNPDNIVLYGISAGADTVMMASGEALPGNVRAVIEDCGYTSVMDEFSYQLKQIFGAPRFPIIYFSSAVTRIRAGFWFSEGDAVAQVAKSVTPTLFIHGGDDTFVPSTMLDTLYEAASCEKQRLLIEGAGHAMAASTDEELYWSTVDAFLAEYLV